MRLRVLFPLLLSIGFTACQSDVLYQQSHSLPDTGWTYSDSLAFVFAVPDTTRLYDVLLRVRHGRDFPFQNLYTRIHTVFPSGQRDAQLLSLEVMDQVGFWQGDCGRNDCLFEVPVQEKVYFRETGEYRIVLEQYARRDSLPAVESIGLKVVSVGQRK